MAHKLFEGHSGLSLLANSLATGAGLFVLIQTLGPISGAHMNPVVSFVECLWGRMTKHEALSYTIVQILGAYAGVLLVHLMFNVPVFDISVVSRTGIHLWISEIVATLGLIVVVALSGKKHVEFAPLSVSLYILSAYWFTSSTSFANPAVTFARMFTNSFGGMATEHFIPFVISQFIGGTLAWIMTRKV